jgi:hypothetical protein
MTQPPPVHQPGSPRARMKIAGIGCGGLVGLLLLLAVISTIIGPPKKTNTAATSTITVQASDTAAASAGPSPDPTTAAAATPSSPAPATASPTIAAAVETTANPTPAPATSSCPPVGDIVVWYRAPTLPDSAQMLGGADPVTCASTFDYLQHTSPTGDGYCTEAAWASDNPGYNADETPAKRIKKVQMWVGPSC